MSSRNSNGEYRSTANEERATSGNPDWEPGVSQNPLVGRPAWHVGMPWDPAWGKHPNSMSPGRPKKGESLTDLIHVALDEEIDCYYGGKVERITRRKIWARHIVDMAVYGEIELPSKDEIGVFRTIKFSADDYAKHVIKMIRYLEPPVVEPVNPAGVTNIIFDIPITVQGRKEEPSKQILIELKPEPPEEG